MWGSVSNRNKSIKEENVQLSQFKRGIYLRKNTSKGTTIKKSDIYFAFPAIKNQLKANDFLRTHLISTTKILSKDSPLKINDINIIDNYSPIKKIRDEVKTLLDMTNVILPKNARLEVSHHYGIQNFYKYGITMINIINHSYCKKLIIMLPGQKHPAQFHKVKEESFFILHGTISLTLDKKKFILKSGDLKTIKKNEVHEFSSKHGAVIEELSTEHIKSDSFYLDKKIDNNKNRKSFIYL